MTTALATKTCRRCGQAKPVTAFHAHPRTADRLQSYCAACSTAYKRAWRELHPEQWRQLSRDGMRRYRTRQQAGQEATQ